MHVLHCACRQVAPLDVDGGVVADASSDANRHNGGGIARLESVSSSSATQFATAFRNVRTTRFIAAWFVLPPSGLPQTSS
jgi:hypothetical protein